MRYDAQTRVLQSVERRALQCIERAVRKRETGRMRYKERTRVLQSGGTRALQYISSVQFTNEQ